MGCQSTRGVVKLFPMLRVKLILSQGAGGGLIVWQAGVELNPMVAERAFDGNGFAMVAAKVVTLEQVWCMFGQSIDPARFGQHGFHLEGMAALNDGRVSFRHPTVCDV